MNKVLSKKKKKENHRPAQLVGALPVHSSAQSSFEGCNGFLSCGIRQVTPERCISHTSLMSQTNYRDLEGGDDPGMCYAAQIRLVLVDLIVYTTDDHHHQPRSTPNQPSQVESNFGDSSGPLFSIYSKAAEEEDNKMVERWQKDADGILIFVSPCACIHIVVCINWNHIDWSILCCCRWTSRCHRPGPQAEQSGYFCFLSWQHLPGSLRPEHNTCFHPGPR